MNNVIGGQAPTWIRIIAALGLLWNLYGAYEYLKSVGAVAGGDPAMSAAMPAWVTGAFAIAVFGGALGSLGLLLLKSWSKLLLLVSLIAVLAMDVWTFVLRSDGRAVAGAELGVTVAVAVIAIFLFWVAYDAAKKDWLS